MKFINNLMLLVFSKSRTILQNYFWVIVLKKQTISMKYFKC